MLLQPNQCVVLKKTVFNVTRIKKWMEPLMSNYCAIFELDCNRRGCGFDDNCTNEEWCIDQTEGYQCIPRSKFPIHLHNYIVATYQKLYVVT